MNLDPGQTTAEVRDALSLEYACNQYGVSFNSEGKATCPFHADSRPSFYLWKDDKGVERFQCWPCEARGDVFDLISRFEGGVGFAAALAKATQMLNKKPTDWEPRLRLDFDDVTADDWAGEVDLMRAAACGDPTRLAEAVGFPPEAGPFLIEGFGLGLDANGVPVFPHWDAQGRLRGCKIRYLDGEKASFRGSRYDQLYGAWIPRRHDVVLLAEGERDTIWAAWHVWTERLPLSVYGLPRGASSRVTEPMLASVRGAHTVWTAFDGDEKGDGAHDKWRLALQEDGVAVRRLRPDPGMDLMKWQPDLRAELGL